MGFAFKIVTGILVLNILEEAPEKHDNFWFMYLKVGKIPCWIFFFIFTIEQIKGEAGAELEGFLVSDAVQEQWFM